MIVTPFQMLVHVRCTCTVIHARPCMHVYMHKACAHCDCCKAMCVCGCICECIRRILACNTSMQVDSCIHVCICLNKAHASTGTPASK